MWGTSLCWWANIDYPDNIKDEIMELLFGKSGLQLDIVRYNLGGGSNPDKNIKQNFRLGGNMPCIKKQNGDFDLSSDKLQLSILDLAIERGVDKVEIFSNSPPWWMTKSGVTNGSNKSFDCNLKKEYVDDYVTFLNDSYNLLKEKYPIVSIDPFNEPSNPFWGPKVNQEGCFFDYYTRWEIIRSLKSKDKERQGTFTDAVDRRQGTFTDAVDRRQGSIFIAGVDEFSAGFALFWYIFSPRSLIDRINIHGYRLTYKNITFYFDDFNIWKRLLRWLIKKPIWISEYGYGYNDTIVDSLPLARKIFNDLSILKPEAWVYWQAVEDINGSNWGLLQVDFNNPTIIKIQKQYYVFKHFTRTIKSDDKYDFINKNIMKIISKYTVKYIVLNDTKNILDLSLKNHIKEEIIEYNFSNNYNDYTTLLSIDMVGKSTLLSIDMVGKSTLLSIDMVGKSTSKKNILENTIEPYSIISIVCNRK
jgi:hypothetical protein